MAPLEEARPWRKCSLEAMLVMRLRMDIEIEDWEVEEIVVRLGVSLISGFRELLNLRIKIKEGMARGS